MSDETADETGKADPGKRSNAQAQIERLREQIAELMNERVDMSDRIQSTSAGSSGTVSEASSQTYQAAQVATQAAGQATKTQQDALEEAIATAVTEMTGSLSESFSSELADTARSLVMSLSIDKIIERLNDGIPELNHRMDAIQANLRRPLAI